MPEEPIYLDRNENHYGPAPACYKVLQNADVKHLSWYSKDYLRMKSVKGHEVTDL